MLIKVCGMRDEENIRELAELSVDFVGFIFYEKSPRYSPCPPKSSLRGNLRNIKTVGVFVNETTEQILKIALAPKPPLRGVGGLDVIQLHGNESPEQCADLRQAGFQIIKAFSIAQAADLEQTKRYEGVADYFLFDTQCSGYGGSGQSFDWSVLQSYTGKTPFLLSGGIRPESLEAIRAFSHPQFVGIDLNSGFETAPAVKDIQKLKTFIEKL
jgi:phosphoribosylanthranilate isomerase